MTLNNIQDRLKQIRNDLGLSQPDMAEFVGAKFQTWQRFELGKNLPKGQYLAVLADNGYDMNWLLTGEGTMKKQVVTSSQGIDSLLKDVACWLAEWSQDNKLEIRPDKFGQTLEWCYKTVLKEKNNNPDITATDMRRYLRQSLKVAILIK